MGAGEVQVWIDEIKGAQDMYQKLNKVLVDQQWILRYHIETPGVNGAPATERIYECKLELHNWMKLLPPG